MLQQYWNIEWNEKLSLGISEIDQEHRHFITLINGLNRAIENRIRLEEIRKKIQSILDDWKRHAPHEEALFERYYPDFMEHARAHEQVNQQLHTIMAELDNASFGYEWISAGLRIRDILTEHLLHEDMKCRDHYGKIQPVSPAGRLIRDETGIQT